MFTLLNYSNNFNIFMFKKLNGNFSFLLKKVKKSVLFKYQRKCFSSFVLKNKINSLFMHIHPDVLGKDCPNQYKVNNEKAIQELNFYSESIEKGTAFKEKTLEAYISVEKTDTKSNTKSKISYKKISFTLDAINSNSLVTQSAKISFQLK